MRRWIVSIACLTAIVWLSWSLAKVELATPGPLTSTTELQVPTAAEIAEAEPSAADRRAVLGKTSASEAESPLNLQHGTRVRVRPFQAAQTLQRIRGLRVGHDGSASMPAKREGNLLSWTHEPIGDWTYVILADGFIPQSFERSIGPGEPGQEVDVTLLPCGRLSLQIMVDDPESLRGLRCELFPELGPSRHPMHELLESIPKAHHEVGRGLTPDQNGLVVFEDLLPGLYELYFYPADTKGTEAYRRERDAAPIAGRFLIEAGGNHHSQVDLASMSQIRILVTENGVPVPHAELLVEELRPWPSFFALSVRDRFFNEKVVHADEDGLWIASAWIPGHRYRVGARRPAQSADLDFRPWTVHEVQAMAGSSSLEIPLAQGGVRFSVAGPKEGGEIEVEIFRTPSATATFSPFAREFHEQIRRWHKWDQVRSWEGLSISRLVADLETEVDAVSTVHGLPPGRYGLLASISAEDGTQVMRGVSSEFEVFDGLTDLGEVQLQPLLPFTIQVKASPGVSSALEECRAVVRETDGSRANLELDLDPDLPSESVRIAEGSYIIVLYDKEIRELTRSSPFHVGMDLDATFLWQVPEGILERKDSEH